MHSLIQRLFQKRGIKDAKDLSDEEKNWFDSRQAILSKEKLDVEDIKHFCQTQIDIIEMKWKDLALEQSKKAELIPYHTVYRMLLTAIDSPRYAREALEQELTQLLKG